MGPTRVSMNMLLLAFVGTLALLSLGSYIERYANSGTSTLVTVAGLQSHEERVQDRLNSLESRVAKLVEDAQTKGSTKLGNFIRKELSGVKSAIQREVRQQAATLGATLGAAKPAAGGGVPAGCPRVCLDVAILYHEDDRPMFVDNGVLQSIQRHIQGVRRIHVISRSDRTFQHLLDNRTTWFDEARVPFKPSDWEGRRSGRPLGWLYQQTLKYWAAQFLPDSCPNLMFIDADTVFLRDFYPISYETNADGTCRIRFKYNLSTQDSGAWYGDIENPEYHHFVEFFTGMPKALKNYATAINHWQIMQRDVLEAMARSLRARKGFANTTAAMIEYGLHNNGMSEYEAYFTFAWYFYQDRLAMVNVPFVMRDPKKCSYFNDETTLPYKQRTIVTYFTCHDNYAGDDYYTNCKGREEKCDPALAPAAAH